MKKIVVTIILGVFFLVGFSSSAQAEWYTCDVLNVGATATVVRARLTDMNGAFTNRWFEVDKNNKEIVATLLTALTLGTTVIVRIDSIEAFSPISIVYVNR